VGDLPLGAYHASSAECDHSAMRMLKEGGTDVVKLEVERIFAPVAEAVVKAGRAGHGPYRTDAQLVSKLGGFRCRARARKPACNC